MFVDLVKLVGGLSGDVDHRLRKHCNGTTAVTEQHPLLCYLEDAKAIA
jgi:hypothetical protein